MERWRLVVATATAGAALGTGMGYLLFDTAGSEFESADAGIPPPERPD